MKYTEDEIKGFRLDAIAADLTGPHIFYFGKISDLVEICNGVGSDDMPKWTVSVLSLIYESYAASAAIHDCRYWNSDGSDDNRADADEEFLANMKKQWAKKFGKLRWIKRDAWRDLAKIRLAYRAVRRFGKDAWNDGWKKRKNMEEKE